MKHSTWAAFCHGERGAVTTCGICTAASVPNDDGEGAVAIVEHVGKAVPVGKRVAELLRCLGWCQVIGNGDMHDTSALGTRITTNKLAIRGRRNHEEIYGHDLVDLVRERLESATCRLLVYFPVKK